MRILLVEDDPSFAFLLGERLRGHEPESLEIVHVQSLGDALMQLAAGGTFDVAIVDLGLPDSEGLDTVDAMVASSRDVPVIVLTGLDDEAAAIASLNAGAQDYLHKGQVDEVILRRSIRHAIERHRLDRQRQRLSVELSRALKIEAIGLLAGGVAHDFNNMLTVITGHGRLLQAAMGPKDPLARSISAILTAGERAAQLTAQLLAFSRKHVVSTRPVDMNTIVSEVDVLIERMIGERVQVVIERSSELWSCLADPSQITQVIVNLAVNARDAMKDGGVLTISTKNAPVSADGSRGRDHVQLTVEDTGHGMDEETMSRIFEPFFTTKQVGRGTGLGLASAYAIVEELGGYIDVESALGHGTRFSIFLPRCDGAPTEAAESPDHVAAGGDETILVVEDEEQVRALIDATLRAAGYDVLTAEDGRQAVQVAEAQSRQIDLVVTDVVMPRMNGREMVERLRARTPDLDVLFISGHANDEVLRRGIRREDLNFLAKPFTPETLVSRVRGALDRRRSKRGRVIAAPPRDARASKPAADPPTRRPDPPRPARLSDARARARVRELEATPAPFRRLEILLVDDDPFIRELFTTLLEASGHRVVSIPDPTRLPAALRACSFDIVLSDLNLPHGGGKRVLELVRAHDRGRRTRPVIAVSGDLDGGPQALADGFDDFLAKSISIECLAANVHKIAARFAKPRSIITG
ncbi:MAG: response regulator [Nannocystaceae bacterium]|nr:response regulator [Myxococcales bacterium]